MRKNTFCSYCGTKHTDRRFPKECKACDNTTFDNPLPVVLCLQPVIDDDRIGLLYAKRAILPKIGEWALVGGHMENNGESVEEAAKREFFEETSLRFGNDGEVSIIQSYANNAGHILIACEAFPITLEVANRAVCCPENSEISILWKPTELAFPIHTEIVKKWFAEIY